MHLMLQLGPVIRDGSPLSSQMGENCAVGHESVVKLATPPCFPYAIALWRLDILCLTMKPSSLKWFPSQTKTVACFEGVVHSCAKVMALFFKCENFQILTFSNFLKILAFQMKVLVSIYVKFHWNRPKRWAPIDLWTQRPLDFSISS